MSGHRDTCDSGHRGLYKDKENSMFMGVCAGIAHRFDLSHVGWSQRRVDLRFHPQFASGA